ncbi:Belongs to the class-I aminoacyl-tRNA synthetase [Sparganum proliferum]
MWRLVVELSDFAKNTPVLGDGSASWPSAGQMEDRLRRNRKFVREYMRVVDRVNHHYSKSFVLSSVIANLQKLTSLLLKVSSSTEAAGPTSPLYLRALADLLVMLYPLSPAFACELWEGYRMALCLAPPSLEDSLRLHSAWPYDLVTDLLCRTTLYCSIKGALATLLLARF